MGPSLRRGDPLSEQAKELTVTVIAATMIGVIYGGAVGARRSGEKYKLMNHFTKYNHPMQAQVYLDRLFICRWRVSNLLPFSLID